MGKRPTLPPGLSLRRRKREIPPAPEIVDGGDWQISQSPNLRTAGAQLQLGGGGRLIVPFGEAEEARLVRAHELTHIKESPVRWPRVYNESLMQLVEDARIHSIMRANGFDVRGLKNIIGRQELEEADLTECHPAILVGLALATLTTGEYPRVQGAIRKIDRDDLLDFSELLYDKYDLLFSRPNVETLGAILDDIVRLYGDPPIDGKKEKDNPATGRPDIEELFGYAQGMMGEWNEWGDMYIKRVPLVRRLATKLRGRRSLRPDRRGRRLRYVGRLHVDGFVFAHRLPSKGGGSVLIDTSGSMALSHEDVEMIVQALPGGIVATYAGEHDYGELRIIAEKGRYCTQDDVQSGMGGNIIDGPALRWLAKQPTPRYWVCDGDVTGIGDEIAGNLLLEAANICAENAILRIPYVDELFE